MRMDCAGRGTSGRAPLLSGTLCNGGHKGELQGGAIRMSLEGSFIFCMSIKSRGPAHHTTALPQGSDVQLPNSDPDGIQ